MLKKMDGMVDCQGRLKAFIVSNYSNLLILVRELCSFIGRKALSPNPKQSEIFCHS